MYVMLFCVVCVAWCVVLWYVVLYHCVLLYYITFSYMWYDNHVSGTALLCWCASCCLVCTVLLVLCHIVMLCFIVEYVVWARVISIRVAVLCVMLVC